MLKSKLTGPENLGQSFRSLQEAVAKGIATAMSEVSKQVTEDALSAIRKGAEQAADATAEHFDAEHDTAFEDALFQYVRSIDATVTERPDRIEVSIGVERRVTPSAWSLPWVMRLLEYGGTAFIGGKTVPVPPHPHWRVAADRILRNRRQYANMANDAVAREVLAHLPKR